jgi:hypothetical protein
MQLLLGSGGFRTSERIAVLAEAMRSFFGGVRRLLFVPYALADHDGYLTGIVERGLHAGYDLEGRESRASVFGSKQAVFRPRPEVATILPSRTQAVSP